MDRHPHQIKRERQDKKRRARNVENLSRLRTHIKKVLATTVRALVTAAAPATTVATAASAFTFSIILLYFRMLLFV